MQDYMYKLLEVALDCGIYEQQYWSMTIAEVTRAIESKNRCDKAAAKQQALFDYIQAELIGRSVGRFLVDDLALSPIEEIYPSLFTENNISREEEKAIKAGEISAARFRQFADFHNRKINKEVAKA